MGAGRGSGGGYTEREILRSHFTFFHLCRRQLSHPSPSPHRARGPRDIRETPPTTVRMCGVGGGGHGAGRKDCARTRMLEATKQNTHTPSWLDATAGEGLRLGQKKKKQFKGRPGLRN